MASQNKKFYITTAIDYPNSDPHIGHAYEKVVTDCYARWYRLMGSEVFFVTGTDENGQKLSKAAEKSKQSTMAFVDSNVVKFKKLCADLNISNTDFIRTTEERHKKIVHQLWKTMQEKGDIYLGRYSGNYCLACEAFYTDSQAKDGKCPTHETPLSYIEETGYFFKLSQYHDWITQHITDHSEFLFPSNIRTEILSRLNGEKLMDLSISRPNQGWGIPVPGDEAHVVYTWFDALISYLAAAVLDESNSSRSEKWWPASVHVIGKDITWFHSVIWPAMLKSTGYDLPKQIYVHGMVLGSDGKRMSKSLGNGVDPQECLQQYPADSLRYHLLKAIPSGQDGAFAMTDLIRSHNTELANELGNLVNRVVKLSIANMGTKIPSVEKLDFDLEILKDVSIAMDEREHHKALASIWTGVRKLNAYIHEQEPWKKKDQKENFHRIMYTALVNLNLISALLLPFIPDSADRAMKTLGGADGIAAALGLKRVEFNLRDDKPLFPRIETDKK